MIGIQVTAARSLAVLGSLVMWAGTVAAQSGVVHVDPPVTPFHLEVDLRRLPSPPAPPPASPAGPCHALGSPTNDGFVRPFCFEGLPSSGGVPDTNGDVGPNHYIQATNAAQGSQVQIFAKDGRSLAGPFILRDIARLASAPPPANHRCLTHAKGDPIALYDSLRDRWLLSEFTDTLEGGAAMLCVYISRSSDPTSGYDLYAFPSPEPDITFDYFKIGVWPDGYYGTSNESIVVGGIKVDVPTLWVFDRERMLAGEDTRGTLQTSVPPLPGFGGGFQALTPADLDGTIPPPPGAPGLFLRQRDHDLHSGVNHDVVEVWEMRVDWSQPRGILSGSPFQIPVAEFRSDVEGCDLGTFCIPEPEPPRPPMPTNHLDPSREVLMWRLQYRNFGSFPVPGSPYQTLAGSFTVNAASDRSNHFGARWFVLENRDGTWQATSAQGTQAPDSQHRFLPSAALDGRGNLAIGYSVSSSTVHPGLRYAGRPATYQGPDLPYGEVDLASGTGSQPDPRWGDYNSMTVDPADNCTFWFTGAYSLPSPPDAPSYKQWATRIGSFRFDQCAHDLGVSFSAAASSAAVRLRHGASDSLTITVKSRGGFGSAVELETSALAVGITATFDPARVAPPPNGEVTTTLSVSASSEAVQGTYSVVVTLQSGGLRQSIPITVTILDADFAATLGVPACLSPGSACDSGPLLRGRDGLGPELHAPNTLDGSCTDGTAGVYRQDESIERLSVASFDAANLTGGKPVMVRADVWIGDPSDALDFFYASDARHPSWSHAGTVKPVVGGGSMQTLGTAFQLPTSGSLQAIRAQWRRGGAPSSCGAGDFNDRDDLVFAVELPPPAPLVRWKRQFGTAGDDTATAMAVSASDRTYVAGSTAGGLEGNLNHGGDDIFIKTFLADGSPLATAQFGTPAEDTATAMVLDDRVLPPAPQIPTLVVTGNTAGALGGGNRGSFDVFVARLGLNGRPQWIRQFGTPETELAFGVAVDGGKNIVVVGQTFGNLNGRLNEGGGDAFVMKLDPSGAPLWTQLLGTSDESAEAANVVGIDVAGNVFVAGQTSGELGGPRHGVNDVFVAKLSAGGSVEWIRQIGTSGDDRALGLALDAAGNIVATGRTSGSLGSPSAGSFDAFAAKLDAAGHTQWIRQFGTAGNDLAADLDVDGTGRIFITGYLNGAPPATAPSDAFVAAFGADGAPIGMHTLGSSAGDGALALDLYPDGDMGIVGWTLGDLAGQNAGGMDAFALRLSPAALVSPLPRPAGLIWRKDVASTEQDFLTAVDVLADDGIVVAGWTDGDIGGAPIGGGNTLVERLSPDGATVWTQRFGGPRTSAWGVAADAQGQVLVAGQTPRAPQDFAGDGLLTRLDASGLPVWQRQFGTPFREDVAAVTIDSEGGIAVVGSTFGDLDGPFAAPRLSTDGFVRKHRADGTRIWTQFIDTSRHEDRLIDVARGADGVLFVLGGSVSVGGTDNASFVAKLGRDGSVLWRETLPTPSAPTALAVDATGAVVVVGSTDGSPGAPNAGEADLFVCKLSAAGAPLWASQFGSSTSDRGAGVAVDRDGIIFVVGTTEGGLAGPHIGPGTDVVVMKLSSDGELTSAYQVGSPLIHYRVTGTVLDHAGGLVVTGHGVRPEVRPTQVDADILKLSAP